MSFDFYYPRVQIPRHGLPYFFCCFNPKDYRYLLQTCFGLDTFKVHAIFTHLCAISIYTYFFPQHLVLPCRLAQSKCMIRVGNEEEEKSFLQAPRLNPVNCTITFVYWPCSCSHLTLYGVFYDFSSSEYIFQISLQLCCSLYRTVFFLFRRIFIMNIFFVCSKRCHKTKTTNIVDAQFNEESLQMFLKILTYSAALQLARILTQECVPGVTTNSMFDTFFNSNFSNNLNM